MDSLLGNTSSPSATAGDPERLAALRSYHILDSPAEASFDRLTRLAATQIGAPIALLNFVEADRQWCKSSHGLAFEESPLEDAFCAHTVHAGELLVVPDATADPRFADNPLVTGPPHIRFYAGAPLVDQDGFVLGSLCVIDQEPRTLSATEASVLRDLAALAVSELRLRREDERRAYTEALLRESGRLSEMVARRRPLVEVLRAIADWLDDLTAPLRWALLVPAASGSELRLAVAPSLPPALAAAYAHVAPERLDFSAGAGFTTSRAVLGDDLPLAAPVQSDASPSAVLPAWHRHDYPLVSSRGELLGVWVGFTEDDGRRPESWHAEALGAALRISQLALEAYHQDAAQARSKALTHEILAQLPDSVQVLGADGTVLQLNAACRQGMEATSDEQVLGRRWPDLWPSAHRHAAERALAAARRGESSRFQAPAFTFTGVSRRWDVTLKPLPVGPEQRTLVVARDVTEQERHKAELVAAKEQAEEMNRLKSAFLTNMSHEIRTPLTSIIGFADLLSLEAEGETRELLELIRESGRRLMETLISVLDLAQIESRTLEVVPSEVDLRDETEAALDLFHARAVEKGLTLQAQLPAHALIAEIDRRAYGRVVVSLLSNALKFTEVGDVTVTLRVEGAHAVLTVADTGVGMAPSFLGKIYEAFSQESDGLARTHEGNGIGLTITKALVEMMHGTIDVASTKGAGTTFTVRLPLAPPASASVADPAAVAALDAAPRSDEQAAGSDRHAAAPAWSPRARPKVLYVEDNADNQFLACAVLRDRYDVTVASDGRAAIWEAQQQAFDVFLVDINLGTDMDGVDVLRVLRTLPDGGATPAVACTAYGLAGDRDRYLAAGFDGYVPKPYAKHQLLGTLAAVQQGRTA